MDKYELEFFAGTEFIQLTRKNIDFIMYIVANVDSTYRKSFSQKPGSSYNIMKDYANDSDWVKDENKVSKLCKKLNDENHTHLHVGNGLKNMVICINRLGNELLEQIERGDSSVVNTLAKVDKISRFSFASKFCAYVSRYIYNADDYCIYDDVVQSVLPYYVYQYVGKQEALTYVARTNGNVNQFKENNNYEGYRKLIEKIIAGIKDKHGIVVTKEEFDRVLWYYYKGDRELVKNAIAAVNASRG